jgi:hypothetical protein
MKRLLMLLLAVTLVSLAGQAQDSVSSTRVATQHKISKQMLSQLPQTEQNIIATLKDGNLATQCQALQDVRELEQMFPAYPFAELLVPLEGILKDEHGDNKTRMLAALALDELHSDAGDQIINQVAAMPGDGALQVLCSALLVRGDSK